VSSDSRVPPRLRASAVRFWFSDHARSPDYRIIRSRAPPARPFSYFCCNKDFVRIDASVALARRLGGPWATPGPPKGHQIPNPVGRGSQLVKDARRQGSPRLKSSLFSLQARNLKHQFQFEAEGRNPEQSRRGKDPNWRKPTLPR
jgi:hypothetical protein